MKYTLKNALRNLIQRNSYIIVMAFEIALTKKKIKHSFLESYHETLFLTTQSHMFTCSAAV